MNRIFRCLVTIFLLVSASQLSTQIAAADQSVNLLVNPSFEGLYSNQCCENTRQFQVNTPISEVQVAYGWTAWWVEPDASHPNQCDGCTPWSRPQFNSSTILHSGLTSQFYYTAYSIHQAGIHQAGVYQRVSGLQPGQQLQFSSYMMSYSNLDNPFEIKVGIDPTGGVDPFSSNVVWGPAASAPSVWLLYTVNAVAQNSTVTVFTYSRPSWAYQTEAIYLDNASLVVTGQGPFAVSAPNTATYILSQNGNCQVITPPGLPVPNSVAGTTNPTSYVVQKGDNLSRLSQRFGVSITALKAANNLKTDVIGQTLIIPSG